MGILQNRLGVNLTDHEPLIEGVFGSSSDEGGGSTSDFRLLTESGSFLLTEAGQYITTEQA